MLGEKAEYASWEAVLMAIKNTRAQAAYEQLGPSQSCSQIY